MSPIKKTILSDETSPTKNINVLKNKLRSLRKSRIALLVIIVGFAIWLVLSLLVNINSWKAVFLDSGQVFFGKFVTVPFSKTITLHKTYYFRSASSTDSTDVVSIKDSLHNPQDFMVISRSHILYTEQLSGKGIVAQALDNRENKSK